MVQTFLPFADFDHSARSIDPKRLSKQRVESYQILCILQDLAFLSEHLEIPRPTPISYDTDYAWIRQVVKEYKKQSYRFTVLKSEDNSYTQVDMTNTDTKFLQAQGEKEGFRVVTLGFGVYHPIVHMWIGYDNALRAYINAHINEWVERGNQNNMRTYSVPETYERPGWTNNPTYHQNHRAALLQKELTRNEKPWYQDRPDFIEAGPFDDYAWVRDY